MISDLKPHYRTGRDDLRKDFFTRCLADCTTYERAAGYFSSTALLSWADALRIPKRLDGYASSSSSRQRSAAVTSTRCAPQPTRSNGYSSCSTLQIKSSSTSSSSSKRRTPRPQ